MSSPMATFNGAQNRSTDRGLHLRRPQIWRFPLIPPPATQLQSFGLQLSNRSCVTIKSSAFTTGHIVRQVNGASHIDYVPIGYEKIRNAEKGVRFEKEATCVILPFEQRNLDIIDEMRHDM